jgi:hypothetical protein
METRRIATKDSTKKDRRTGGFLSWETAEGVQMPFGAAKDLRALREAPLRILDDCADKSGRGKPLPYGFYCSASKSLAEFAPRKARIIQIRFSGDMCGGKTP